jgi:hypothetical protein
VEDVTDDIARRFGADVLAEIQIPTVDDPAEARRRLARALAARADGNREPLERLRSHFIRRLHGASDDFAATAALRVTELALTLVPRPEGVWAWGRRDPEQQGRRWWQRREKALNQQVPVATS